MEGEEQGDACVGSSVMLEVSFLLRWLEGCQDEFCEPPANAFEAIENSAKMFTLERVRSFLLEATACAWKARHEAAFSLPGEQH